MYKVHADFPSSVQDISLSLDADHLTVGLLASLLRSSPGPGDLLLPSVALIAGYRTILSKLI